MKNFWCSSASVLALLVAPVWSDAVVSKNASTSDSKLQTWWHNNGEVNYQSPVQEQNVRQSHIYSAWVKSNAEPTSE